MNQRLERLAGEIRQILSEILTRQEIKDPRVQEAGLVTVTHVRLTGDLRQATALFMVHGASAAALERVCDGLNHAAGYLRRRLGRELSLRTIPTVSFEVDRTFEREEKVDALLREIADAGAGQGASTSVEDASEAGDREGGDGEGGDGEDRNDQGAGGESTKADV